MSGRPFTKTIRRRDFIRVAAGTAAAAATSSVLGREAAGALGPGQIRTIAGLASLSAWPLTGIPGPALRAGLGSSITLAARTPGSLLVGTTQSSARPGQEMSLIAQWTDAAGSLLPVGGTGTRGFVSERICIVTATGHALDFHFVGVAAIAIEPGGALLVASVRRPCNGALLRIRPTGTVELIAGGGPAPASVGTRALGAQLSDPSALAVDSQGSIYIAELVGGRVRKLSPSGALTTVAGGSGRDQVRDGPNPTKGSLLAPAGLALDKGGGLYISEARGARVRRLNQSGTIETIAGTGRAGWAGDGGPALRAQLDGPRGLVVGANGVVYVADHANHRIRAVTPDGVITTIAGTGQVGYGGDGSAAKAAALNGPTAVALAGGSLYVADEGNRVVREIGL